MADLEPRGQSGADRKTWRSWLRRLKRWTRTRFYVFDLHKVAAWSEVAMPWLVLAIAVFHRS